MISCSIPATPVPNLPERRKQRAQGNDAFRPYLLLNDNNIFSWYGAQFQTPSDFQESSHVSDKFLAPVEMPRDKRRCNYRLKTNAGFSGVPGWAFPGGLCGRHAPSFCQRNRSCNVRQPAAGATTPRIEECPTTIPASELIALRFSPHGKQQFSRGGDGRSSRSKNTSPDKDKKEEETSLLARTAAG